jgi:glycosyltransferase involved in cell wall biosynthesis
LKILIIHRYFKPDKTPCSYILYDIAKFLSKKNEVHVLSSQPSYLSSKSKNYTKNIEKSKKLHIERILLPTDNFSFFLRVINAIKLSMHIIKKILLNKYQTIIVTTTPPILCAFIVSILTKLFKIRMIYYCMDVNPEISLVLKDMKKNFLYKFFLILEDVSCQIADPVLVHSEDMLKTMRKRKNGYKYKIKIINNFANLGFENKIKKRTNLILKNKNIFLKKNHLKMIYAGNIGRFQDLDTFVRSASKLSLTSKVEILIMGNGVKRNNILKLVKKNSLNIKFLDYQDPTIAKNIIRKADVGIVTLHKDMYKYAYPSKIMTYLQQGIPIICLIEKNSRIVQEMLTMNYGFWSPRGNSKKLSQLLEKLFSNNLWKKNMQKNAISAFNKKFSSKKILKKWDDLIFIS